MKISETIFCDRCGQELPRYKQKGGYYSHTVAITSHHRKKLPLDEEYQFEMVICAVCFNEGYDIANFLCSG